MRERPENKNQPPPFGDTDRKFISLLESAPDSMIIADKNGKIVKVNKQTEILFQFSREEIIGKEIEVLIPEEYHNRHRKERRKYTVNPRTRPMGTGLELFGRKKDGTIFPVEVSLSPLHHNNATGETMTIAAIRDVTSQKLVRAELSRRTRELEAINLELEAFSFSVSHDLRAPLRSIEGFSNKILAEAADKLDDRTRDNLSRILKAGRQMNRIIEALLKLSRIVQTEIRPECINLSELVDTAFSSLKETDPARKAEIHIEPGIIVYGDRNLLNIVVQNLLDNAWKYSRKRELSHVEFGTIRRDDDLVYFIRDNGAGFNMQYAGNLFKPFQRLHVNTEFEGTGVGLATVKRIIERHRGTIWAESSENTGTTFFFTLFQKSVDTKNNVR